MSDAPERAKKPIALVGLPGAGKTSIGRRLATRLGLPFLDADAEIEAAAGLNVGEIFERFGEAHFRDGERRVIARLVEGPPCVLATGGGAFANAETRALLLARCTVIWLDGEVERLAKRAGRSGRRPLLRDKDPETVLAALAAARNPLYAAAHLRIAGHGRQERVVEEILAALSAWRPPR